MFSFLTIIVDQTPMVSKPEKTKAKKQTAQKIINRRKTAVEPPRGTASSPKCKTSKANNKAMNTIAQHGIALFGASGSVPTKAMKKCFPRRSTVACAGNENTNDRNNVASSEAKNTDYFVYYKNKTYQTCLYCTNKFSGTLAQHYAKSHPEHEVPISRLSPEMSMKLKMQCTIFKKDDAKKITGLCYFCEEERCALKVSWQR